MSFNDADLDISDSQAHIKSTNEPFTGAAVRHYDNGQLKKRLTYVDGLPYGISEEYFSNGQVKSRGYHKGASWNGDLWMVIPIRDGTWEYYYQNGQLSKKENYQTGQVNGVWESFYKNGQLMSKGEMFPFWDNKDGAWNYYSSDGTLINTDEYIKGKFQAEGHYKDGKKDGLWEWVDYGLGCDHTYFKGTYNKGIKSGLWITGVHYMSPCGIKYSSRDHMHYKDGKLHGSWKTIIDERILFVDGHYEDGLKAGKWTYFSEEGALGYTETYIDGTIIK